MLFIHCPPSMKMQRSLSPFFARKAWPALWLQPPNLSFTFHVLLLDSPLFHSCLLSPPPAILCFPSTAPALPGSSVHTKRPQQPSLGTSQQSLAPPPALFALGAFKKWEPKAHNSLEIQPQNCLISLLAQASGNLSVEFGFTAANSDTQIGGTQNAQVTD